MKMMKNNTCFRNQIRHFNIFYGNNIKNMIYFSIENSITGKGHYNEKIRFYL